MSCGNKSSKNMELFKGFLSNVKQGHGYHTKSTFTFRFEGGNQWITGAMTTVRVCRANITYWESLLLEISHINGSRNYVIFETHGAWVL